MMFTKKSLKPKRVSEMEEMIRKQLEESADVKMKAALMAGEIAKVAEMIVQAYKKGGKVLFCGNGGSAADSQHLACELVSKLRLERSALPAIALTTNTSILTAISNDYGFEHVFERQVEALGRPGDVLIGIGTSGNSENVIVAFRKARKMGLKTVALTGETGGKMAENSEADVVLKVPSKDTQRIQETHIAIGHVLCDAVEKAMFGEKK